MPNKHSKKVRNNSFNRKMYRWSGTGTVASEDWNTLEVDPEWVRYVPGV